MISVYNYFSRLHIYSWMDPVNRQDIYNVVFFTKNYFGENVYFIAYLQEISTD